jgi:hypothetical protein
MAFHIAQPEARARPLLKMSPSRGGFLRRLGHGVIAHHTVKCVAVGIEPGFGEFVAEIDAVMALGRERLAGPP